LGEKIHSSLPVLQISKPFQRYYWKARELKEGHSVYWIEVFLADSLVASKTPIYITNKEIVAAPLAKISAGSVKKGFLRKGFLNPRQAVIAPTAHSLLIELGSHPPREVKTVGVVGLPSPPSCHIIPSSVEGNGFSQSQEWPVRFDPIGEVVVWKKDDDFWDGMPLDWAMDGVHGEESLAILDAMEEEFHRDKIIVRKKTQINYGDVSAPSRRWKGKAHMT
jgi:hypothetical protein